MSEQAVPINRQTGERLVRVVKDFLSSEVRWRALGLSAAPIGLLFAINGLNVVMNVLVLGDRVIGPALAEEGVAAFLRASPSHEARHECRLRKVQAPEGDPPRSAGGGNHG